MQTPHHPAPFPLPLNIAQTIFQFITNPFPFIMTGKVVEFPDIPRDSSQMLVYILVMRGLDFCFVQLIFSGLSQCDSQRCSHLCLLSNNSRGYLCACPTGMKLDDTDHNCQSGLLLVSLFFQTGKIISVWSLNTFVRVRAFPSIGAHISETNNTKNCKN